jgi:outer membrane receptor protein involved in Fe transport
MSSSQCGTRERWRLGVSSFLLVSAALLSAQAAGAQELGRITGRTSDAASQAPLSEVQVYLVGVNMGALSRQNGAYVILNVPAGSYELRAERIGLTTVTRQITLAAGQQLEVNFDLTNQPLGLDEIVVTGTAGAATRREVGNSITQINTADLPDRPPTVMDMLTGMAPGVDVVPQAGGETGQGSNITIRGVNSINTTSPPIIVIDGIRIMNNRLPGVASNTPSPLDQINPNDIERIEIISGPAASTLYGTEATAGVIQIFTRRGSARAPVWTVDLQQGTMWTQKFGMNGIDYLHMDPWICTGLFKCGQYHSPPHTQLYSLSVRGGGQALQYFLSSAYDSELGATPEDQLGRWNIRGNFTLTPLEDLVVQYNAAYTNTSQQNGGTGNTTTGLSLNVFRNGQGYLASADPEVLNQLLDVERTRTIERFTTGGTLTYSPLTNLTNRVTIGYDLTMQEGRTVVPFGFVLDPEGSISVSSYSRRFLTFDYVGTYTANLRPDLRSSFSWGGQATGDFQSTIEASGTGFPGSALPTVQSASSTLGDESRRKIWNSGFFFQNVFDFRNKYFLTLGVRVDGNSTFGKNFNLQAYPKASGSWIVSDEAFWRAGLGEMKLRAAWGRSGRAPGAFVAQRTWTNSGLSGEPAFTPSNLGNPDIGPEVTTELELGFDAAWLNGRIRPQYTYYSQITDDAIQSLSTIPSLGFTSSVNFNVGKVQNWGHEALLGVTVFQTRDWGLDTQTSLSYNRNKVIEWLGITDPALDTDNRVGNPISRTTWTMYHNPEGMGTSYSATSRTYTTQSCEVDVVDANGVTTSVPRPGVDPTIHACSFSSLSIYGYSMPRPTTIINGSMTLRLPYGTSLSARGDWRGGGSWLSSNPIPIGRNVISPYCLPYYIDPAVDNRIKPDTPAIWVRRCVDGTGAAYQVPRDELRIHTISATLPMDFAFPDRIQSSTLSLIWGNVLWHNKTMWGRYPRTGSVSEVGERVPTQSTLSASLRITF